MGLTRQLVEVLELAQRKGGEVDDDRHLGLRVGGRQEPFALDEVDVLPRRLQRLAGAAKG